MNLTRRYALRQAEKEIKKTLRRLANEHDCDVQDLDEYLFESTVQEVTESIIDSWEGALEQKCDQLMEERKLRRINKISSDSGK